MPLPLCRHWICIFLIFNLFADFSRAQRIYLPPSPSPVQSKPATSQDSKPAEAALVLKTYPDGTQKIVPLQALNFYDNGAAFGGPPRLSLYPEAPSSFVSPRSDPISVAPIGQAGAPSSMAAPLPSSVDSVEPLNIKTSAPDPMGGGSVSSPMGGASSSAPVDPLGGGASGVPPLQTVSGKPAPIVGDTTTVQLGEWDSFFLNAGIGASLQGQLTARQVNNGNNRQFYPYTYPSGTVVSGENFTFNPGFRLDLEFGYNFYEWLGVGLQTGLTYNGINQYNVTVSSFPAGSTLPPGSYHNSADGELVQVPVQLNAILRWPGQVKFRPFVGGGIGAVWQQLDVNNYYLGPLDVQGNYCRSAFQFGWNAQAGLTYTVEPGLDFYGAFKILSAFMPVIGNYQFQNSYNFALEVGIQSRF